MEAFEGKQNTGTTACVYYQRCRILWSVLFNLLRPSNAYIHQSSHQWYISWLCAYLLLTLRAKTLRLTLFRHRSHSKVSDQCLINVDPQVFTIWEAITSTSNKLLLEPIGTNFLEIFGQNTKTLFQGNSFKKVICNTLAIGSSKFQYVNTTTANDLITCHGKLCFV